MTTSAQSGAGSGDAPRRARAASDRATSDRAAADDAAEDAVAEASLAEVRFLTVAEVAAVMRVSKMTVYRMVHGGDLPAVRVGRSFRVPEKAVHDYLRSAYIEAG
jgi:excisionase family DNA binding protein